MVNGLCTQVLITAHCATCCLVWNFELETLYSFVTLESGINFKKYAKTHTRCSIYCLTAKRQSSPKRPAVIMKIFFEKIKRYERTQ